MKAGNNTAASNHVHAVEQQVGREVMLLIEEFEQFLDQSPRIPLTGKLVLDEDDVYGFVDHLKRSLPAEIRRAMDVLAQRDRILQQAEAEAETMVSEARHYAERLTSESVITRQAEEEAGRILALAREEARSLRRDADAYAEALLERLDEVLSSALKQVRHGRAFLQQPSAASAPADAPDHDS
ncbi:MAG TPA: hypothetical protein VIL95_06270 [Bacillota bacterium]